MSASLTVACFREDRPAQLMMEMSGVTTAYHARAALLSVVVATTPFRGVEIRRAPRYGQVDG